MQFRKKRPQKRNMDVSEQDYDGDTFDDLGEEDTDQADDLGDEGSEIDDKEKEDDMFDDGFGDDLDDFGGNSTPPMERQYPDLLKGLTDFHEYLRNLYNGWTATTWNEEKKDFLPNPGLLPIMNKVGSNWCITFIKTYVRKNNTLSWLDRDDMNALSEDINRTLYLSLGTRYKEFGFMCYSDVIRVWNEVENASILALSGAASGKSMNFLGGREGGVLDYHTTENSMVSQQGKKMGFMGKNLNKFSDWAKGVEQGAMR